MRSIGFRYPLFAKIEKSVENQCYSVEFFANILKIITFPFQCPDFSLSLCCQFHITIFTATTAVTIAAR